MWFHNTGPLIKTDTGDCCSMKFNNLTAPALIFLGLLAPMLSSAGNNVGSLSAPGYGSKVCDVIHAGPWLTRGVVYSNTKTDCDYQVKRIDSIHTIKMSGKGWSSPATRGVSRKVVSNTNVVQHTTAYRCSGNQWRLWHGETRPFITYTNGRSMNWGWLNQPRDSVVYRRATRFLKCS